MTNPDGQPESDKAVRELYRQLLEAWNKRNARNYTLLFATNANLIGFDGSQVDGQSAIGAHLSALFSHHQTASYVTIVREVRELTPDVVVLRANVGMVPPGKDDINAEVNAVQTMVAVRQEGEWKIALFQNTPSALHGRGQDSDSLTDELRDVLRASKESK